METLIVVLQVLCVAGLASGGMLSLLARDSGRPVDSVANDFEIGYRRAVRVHG